MLNKIKFEIQALGFLKIYVVFPMLISLRKFPVSHVNPIIFNGLIVSTRGGGWAQLTLSVVTWIHS